MTAPIFQRFTDNILDGAVITSSVAPSATYALTTLAAMNPSHRVLWGVQTVTITFTLSTPALGEILCIPMHNLSAGSPGVLTLTNGAGFSEVITLPAVQVDGFPPTLVVDLTALDTAGNRTSNVWNLVIVSNSDNVVFGGAVAIYGPKRSFATANSDNAFTGEWTERETANIIETPNEYLTPYVQEYGTVSRSLEWSVIGTNAEIAAFRDWFRANGGRGKPSLLWPYPDETEDFPPYFGRWQSTFEIQTLTSGLRSFSATFDEWPKGQVIP